MTSQPAIRPILFNTLLVPPALSGLKTQTRRTKGLDHINKNPDKFILDGLQIQDSFIFHNKVSHAEFWIKCPFGVPGDILWVRENFCEPNIFDGNEEDYYYKSDNIQISDSRHRHFKEKWRPSIHMPKKACRLFLFIKSVRIERLQDISTVDSIAEGTGGHDPCYLCINGHVGAEDLCEDGFFTTAKDSFRSLWKHLSGSESWNQNPWVWVIEFERIDKPENF